ncbi:hypothetical protein BDP27DRAFT_1415463 [Rhodocollybia butyracea]|uniref:Uncharacterized protein n=1 Tax=Rhodocollybia butyracea TaxID=206335 RepID=A0A9P5PYU7_9AGAR|nr:hypothetical protein BDP27DRAFT_1450421 [Rhodocollybia butyracea]KAF9075089.1 hypothetical protein BDP27DRAFT_1415463 [Rhodocollybia butyracea]
MTLYLYRRVATSTVDTCIIDVTNIIGHITDNVDPQIMRILQDSQTTLPGVTPSPSPVSQAENEEFRDVYNTLSGRLMDVRTSIQTNISSLQVGLSELRDYIISLPDQIAPATTNNSNTSVTPNSMGTLGNWPAPARRLEALSMFNLTLSLHLRRGSLVPRRSADSLSLPTPSPKT